MNSLQFPPIVYHYFSRPLPYLRALQLQESIHAFQILQRRSSLEHQDVLLLLQHKPVYTGGRRQTESETASERARLRALGADFVLAERGGELTYHGPGQIVGYPLLDLGRTKPAIGIRDYISRLQYMLSLHLREAHGLTPIESEHTGVFLGEHEKVASVGVQVRHRLTSHGFAMNITHEPRPWFDEIVACGLADVKATSIESARAMKRQMIPLEVPVGTDKLGELVYTLEQELKEEREDELYS